MMTPFFTHRSDGLITGIGQCLTEYLEQQSLNGNTAVAGYADPRLNYVFDGEICEYTAEELQAKNNLPDGWVWKMPERVAVDMRTMQGTKDKVWGKVKADRTTAELAHITVNGSVYDSNKEQISGAVQLALLAKMSGQPFEIGWTLADNTTKMHNADEMIAVGVALGQRVSMVYDAARLLRAQIADATTIEELDAMTWTF